MLSPGAIIVTINITITTCASQFVLFSIRDATH
jgi:hypothetical protein